MKVSVVIVNWNGQRYLDDCLSAVLAQTYPHCEVVLVDNASTDGSVELVTRKFPHVRVIQNEKNLGFAAGNNIGIRATSGEYVATLNNDTQADSRWLEELVAVMSGQDMVGMAASKMLFTHRPEVINSTGICLDLAGIAWDRRGGELDTTEGSGPIEVFGPCAGAALYCRTVLDKVGLFDEDFFCYLEDVDLAWRARLMGWRCLYVPTARVYHIHSGTGQEGSPFKNYLLGRNKVWTIIKNYPSTELFLLLPVILAYDLGSIPYTLLARGDASALRGRLAALRHLSHLWQKRREVQRRRIISFAALAEQLSPLESPLAVLRRYRHLQDLPTGSSWQQKTQGVM
jgi:GT2 family glycosyltransferase